MLLVMFDRQRSFICKAQVIQKWLFKVIYIKFRKVNTIKTNREISVIAHIFIEDIAKCELN